VIPVILPLAIVSAAAVVPAGFWQAEPPGGQDLTRPGKKMFPVPGKPWVQNISYHGTVTAVDRNSITILPPDGTKARRFPIVKELAEAIVPPGSRLSDDIYLPSDVRVGDRVKINYCDDWRDGLCFEITILRRPGGRVPPGYAQFVGPPETNIRHHEFMNALQDREEKGIPLPAKYDPEQQPKYVPGQNYRPDNPALKNPALRKDVRSIPPAKQ
jgi:hypothetical protein